MDNEMLSFFLEESTVLLKELITLGISLKKVGIPNKDESEKLSEFAQKLNRLIGGTASMGFEMFTPLSRKTSILAEKCAEVSQISIRLIILNLNDVISVLSESFQNIESIKNIEKSIPNIEDRIDICMTAFGIKDPEIETQDQIDDIFESFL